MDLVKYSDEAIPEISSFSHGEKGTCISEFFSFSPDVTPYTISWYLGAGKPPGRPQEMVPVAREAGGYLVCLNFKTSSIAVEIRVQVKPSLLPQTLMSLYVHGVIRERRLGMV